MRWPKYWSFSFSIIPSKAHPELISFRDNKIYVKNITADSDCSHEIKRCLILRIKVMTNLDTILKSRDITLPTKVHIVKATVFPYIMYGYESWIIKKVEY